MDNDDHQPPVILIDRPGKPTIATRWRDGTGPVIVFLPGYMSDMDGGKAMALDQWAAARGAPMLRFDYSGCGHSDGVFGDGTLDQWCADAIDAIAHHAKGRQLLLVGSSMGGWIALLLALRLGDRVVGLAGIAAAPDFTDWGYDAAQKAALARGETIHEHNPYGPDPTPTHPAFWESGQASMILGGPIAIDAPVRLLHGQADPDVPWQTALRIAERLRSNDVQVRFIKDGDHRLSRPADIAALCALIGELSEPAQ